MDAGGVEGICRVRDGKEGDGVKIHRLVIRNYRGVEFLDQELPPAGAIVTGRNGAGKTTALKAVGAALAARDIGDDAIRIGADKAEILIDLDAISVRRVITPKTTSVTVTGANGFKAPKPQTFLAELLGTSPLDPLDLLLAKPAERRAKVLAALPVTVTAEQLRQWAPDLGEVDTSGHGLEVLSRVRASYYERRAVANREEATAAAEAKRLAEEAAAREIVVRMDAPSIADAENARTIARRELAQLEVQDAEAHRSEERARTTREKIDRFRTTAAELRATAETMWPLEGEADRATGDVVEFEQRVADLERQLVRAKESLVAAREILAERKGREAHASKLSADAERHDSQARHLETALAEIAVPTVDPTDIDRARAAVVKADAAIAAARAEEAARASRARAESASAEHVAVREAAARLDEIVKALTHDAPAALLAGAKAIPGLGLDGDEVTLDGKRLDALCGAEQMRFCVDIAKRLNAKSRILVVDGLERLDPDAREEFVRFATADDWQLLASLVTGGETQFAAIESDAARAAE
jgi:hypothetical protein